MVKSHGNQTIFLFYVVMVTSGVKLEDGALILLINNSFLVEVSTFSSGYTAFLSASTIRNIRCDPKLSDYERG